MVETIQKLEERNQVDIHQTAIIDPKAQLGKNVKIGPFCVIGADVVLGDDVVLHSHVVIDGITHVGSGTEIFPFASIGLRPQDLKFKGEKSTLIIGKNNMIREYVTMNPGTEGDRMTTTVGDNCLFMMSSHVAHDCDVGNNVILANNATLAGHVSVGDFVIIGGLSAVRQFVRIGSYAMIGGMSGVEQDVVPFGMVMGDRAKLAGLNLVGLERRGFDKDSVKQLRLAYQDIFQKTEDSGTLHDRLDQAETRYSGNDLVRSLTEFAKDKSKVGLCQPKA